MGFFCQSMDLWVAGWYSEIEYIETKGIFASRADTASEIKKLRLQVPSTHRLPIPIEATTFRPSISLTVSTLVGNSSAIYGNNSNS